MPFADYLREAVLEPLGMTRSELRGSPAADLCGPARRPAPRSAASCWRRRLVAPETLAESTAVAFPGLDGVLPDFGRMTPNDWGLGFEIRDAKPGHWIGTRRLAARVRPLRRQRARSSGSTRTWPSRSACSPTCEFGEWAKEAWPPLSDAVVAELRGVA